MTLGEGTFYALLGVLAVDVLAVAWWDVRHMLYVGAHYHDDERVLRNLDEIEAERGWREWKDAA